MCCKYRVEDSYQPLQKHKFLINAGNSRSSGSAQTCRYPNMEKIDTGNLQQLSKHQQYFLFSALSRLNFQQNKKVLNCQPLPFPRPIAGVGERRFLVGRFHADSKCTVGAHPGPLPHASRQALGSDGLGIRHQL